MSIEQELPGLLEELAGDHRVGQPPVLEPSEVHPTSRARSRSGQLTIAAVAACSVVLIGGLVAVGSRNDPPSPANSPTPEPVSTQAPQSDSLTPTSEPASDDVAPDVDVGTAAGANLDLVRIEASATGEGTTGIVLVFDGVLPDRSAQRLDDATNPNSDGIRYATQSSDGQSISVCGDTHTFPPPGVNRTVDVFVPSDWFGPGSPVNLPIEWDRDGVLPAKIVVCEPRNGVVQISIWGSASDRMEDINVRVDARTIAVEIKPGPTQAATETPAGTPTIESDPAQCGPLDPALLRDDFDVLVSVALDCGPGVYPFDIRLVERVVPNDGNPLEAAVAQLLSGATPEEFNAGFGSAFSSATVGQFHSVRVENGIAIIDLTTDFVQTSNLSTSNLSMLVRSQIEATVFQFPEISGLDYRVDGERWCGWENWCDAVPFPITTRPPD